MRTKHTGFLMIVCGAMLLSWVHAWAAFVMPLVGYHPFSLMEGAFILALAVTITRLHRGRGWRMIWIMGVQTIGVTCAILWMIHCYLEWPGSFGSMDWVTRFMAQQHGLSEWMRILLVLFWVAVLWIGGIKLALRRPDHLTVASRFDLGAAAFLALLLIRLIMIAKGVAAGQGKHCEMNFIAFFMFGLLALGMARYGETGEKDYVTTYRGVGVILAFTSLVILLGGGLVVLFLPVFTRAAELGHDVLKTVAKPAFLVLEGMLRFVLVRGCHMGPQKRICSGPDVIDTLPIIEVGKETGWLQYVLAWGALVLGCLILLIIIGIILYYLIRWLASRRVADLNSPSLLDRLMRWLSAFKDLIDAFFARMTRKRGKRRGAEYLYTRLLCWGAHCGLSHVPVETPLEYGTRLGRQFPRLRAEITLIVDLFNRSVYGAIDPDRGELARVGLAWHRLRSPRLWPVRFKAWFLSPGG